MNRDAFLNLVGVEVRRGKAHLLLAAGVLLVLPVLAAIGWLTPAGGSLVLVTVGISGFGAIPSGVVKDKLGGTMEFLATLPVSAATVVGARFAAAVLFAAPGAMMLAAACGWFVYPLIGTGGRGQVVWASFVVAWAALSAVPCLLAGLLTRFKLNKLVRSLPIGVIASGAAGVYAIDLLFGDPLQAARAVMARDLGLHVWVAIVVLGAVGVIAGSFVLARQGIVNFRPELDSIEW